MLSGVFTAIVNAFNTIVSVLSENLPTIVTLVVAVGVAGLAFYLVRRFGRSITGWFRRLIPF
ncbi:MAG: hypothetical protein DRZ82_09840 [Thermoprotei archaeon]|nr:MAG: hypothetical protein DRZ82_09840 [Thermoprotei archaeon]